MTNCCICDEKINKSTRKEIICSKCDFISCSSCYRKYFKTCNTEGNCMNCKEIFSYSFLYSNFPRTYIDGEYKQHLREILYNNEVSFFPETLPYVEERKKRREIYKKIQNLNMQIHELYVQMDNISIEKQNYVKKCMTYNCKGFLNNKWECSLCEKKYCKKCFEIKETEQHSCLEENINSANIIKKETKSCPSCGIYIYKIEGCDQFFCTNCNTCFDWKTLKIYDSKTRIHNPHYFEYLQKNAKQNQIDNNIDITEQFFENNIIDQGNFEYYFNQWKDLLDEKRPLSQNSFYKREFFNIYTNMNHFINEMRNINYTLNQENRNLRISYLMGIMPLEEFKKEIQSKYKKNKKLEDVVEEIDKLVKRLNKTVVLLFKNQFEKKLSKDTFIEIYKEYLKTMEEYKKNIDNIGFTFKCSVNKYLYYPCPLRNY